jgi:acyl-CoA synthetase (AMP-forming)/AMP-acid ligase II
MHLIPAEWQTSNNKAVFENGAWSSYAALCNRVEALAADLPKERCLAFCFCRTDSATIVNYLACLLAGHPVLLLDANLHPDAKRDLIAHYQPELLLTSAEWQAGTPANSELHPDLTLLLSTSGTTGSPKLVRLSARNILSNADSIRLALNIQPSDCAMCSLPFHYSYGLSVLHSHLSAGASLALTSDGILSNTFWDVCRQAEATSMAGVPYTYQLLQRLPLDQLSVPKLTTLTQAGGKLSPPLISHFHAVTENRNGRFFVMYGQTEATARMSILSPLDLPGKLGSVGLPIPGGSFSINSGEVVYSGPNVMLGYASAHADLARGDEMHGRLRTGDLGSLDNDGYLYISGRLKREAKVAGHRVNLDEVEDLLKQHGPTAALEGAGKIVIFCEWGDAARHSLALRELAQRLHFSLHAFEFRYLPALPISSNGKIDYASLAVLP